MSLNYDKKKQNIITQVVTNLKNVYDPEIPSVSVMDLGLIYDIEVLSFNVPDADGATTAPAAKKPVNCPGVASLVGELPLEPRGSPNVVDIGTPAIDWRL